MRSEPDIPDLNPFPPLVRRAVVLAGPTASGKSGVALELAEALDGEILSLDSIAVYRDMDIGSAKPSAADRDRVPHHLLDLVPPTEDFSVARYLRAAHRAVRQIEGRGRLPIFVGGTPLFLKGILRGFDPGPPADWEFRERVERDVRRYGIDALRERLRQVDPLAAHRIGPSDTRRMIRALEYVRHTGVPISHRQTQFDRGQPAHACRVFALSHDRQRLHDRINRRVETMFDRGLVEETQGLLRRYGELSRTARQAVGYREVLTWLGRRDETARPHETARRDEAEGPRLARSAEPTTLEQVKRDVATHTRQLAKRQETWFRSLSEIRPIPVAPEDQAEAIAARIADHIGDPGETDRRVGKTAGEV